MPPQKKAPVKRDAPVKSMEELRDRINKRFKSEVIITGSQLKGRTFERCTTGSLSCDLMLGGGWPLNVWNEVIGNESNGKTVFILKTIAANMALDPNYTCLWVASEDFVPDWAERLGVDMDRMVLAETNVTEQAYQIMLDTLEGRIADAIILDSLPALVASEEAQKSMEEYTMTLNARMTGQFFRKAGDVGRRSLTTDDRNYLGIIVNQWRDKVGISYGDPRTTPGGKGKNFSFFTRLEISRDEWITHDGTTKGDKVGISIKAHSIKNKTAPQRRTGVVDFYFDDNDGHVAGDYDSAKEVVSVAIAFGIIETNSSWYTYGDDKWQGATAVVAEARSDVGLLTSLTDEVRRIVLHEDVEHRDIVADAVAKVEKKTAAKKPAKKTAAKRPALGRPS